MRILIICYIVLLFKDGNSQIINPKIWYVGYQTYDKKDTNTLDTAYNIVSHGANVLNFKKSPLSISRYGYSLSLGACNAQIYDKNDSLILYSNGSKVFNGRHRLIDGGDRLSYGSDWNTSPFAGNYFGEYVIRAYPSPLLILPSVSNSNQYYIFSVFINSDNTYFPKLTYSMVDMSLNGGKGKVIEKEVLIKAGDFTPAITACKHGNGRDWWIIAREYGKTNFTLLLLNESGVKVFSENQLSAWDLSDRSPSKGNNSNKFSWNGGMFASFTHLGIEFFDFNRCTGELSSPRYVKIPYNDSFPSSVGGCFSSKDNMLYTSNLGYLYQIELKDLKVRKIANWDRYEDTMKGANYGWFTNFGSCQLSINGKIYFSTGEATRYMHTIENPNDTGILCNFKQRSVKLLTWNNGVPHYPNYELGAVADKCGESGIARNELDKIEVYPNPASSYVSLVGISPIKLIHYRIFDLLGKVLSQGETMKEIDLSSLSNGHYFITLLDDSFRQVTKRIEVRR